MWNYGDIASDGLKQVAEWGAIGTMQKEIKNHVKLCLIDKKRFDLIVFIRLNLV